MRVNQWFLSPRVSQRFVAVWAIGVFLNLTAWTLAYLFLPEGILRQVFPVADIPLETSSLWSVFFRIFAYNLLIAGGLIALANLFRVGEFPLGYVVALSHWILFGLFLGTNSFTIAHGSKLPPAPLLLITRSGFYEISAYSMIAAATTGLFIYHQSSWLNWRTEKQRDWKQIYISMGERVMLLAAVVILIASNLYEAISIMQMGR